MPLRRAASLPPTSPSVVDTDTPPVFIVGSSVGAGGGGGAGGQSNLTADEDVDVTFGFELNEQLLALSATWSSSSSPLSSSSSSSSPLSSSLLAVDQQQQKSPSVGNLPDFASRYRERPDLANPKLSRRTIEIVDFISQGICPVWFLFYMYIYFIQQI